MDGTIRLTLEITELPKKSLTKLYWDQSHKLTISSIKLTT